MAPPTASEAEAQSQAANAAAADLEAHHSEAAVSLDGGGQTEVGGNGVGSATLLVWLKRRGLEKCVAVDGSVEWVSAHSKVRLVSLSLSLIPFRSLTPDRSPIPQDRFMREGAKSLIWNQHSLGRTSDLSAPKDSPESLEA